VTNAMPGARGTDLLVGDADFEAELIRKCPVRKEWSLTMSFLSALNVLNSNACYLITDFGYFCDGQVFMVPECL
jgi:hypothetical protein